MFQITEFTYARLASLTPPPTKRARKEACSPSCGYRLGWEKRRVAAALVRENYTEPALAEAA